MDSATSRGRVPGATCRVEPSGNFRVIIETCSPKVPQDSTPLQRAWLERDTASWAKVHGTRAPLKGNRASSTGECLFDWPFPIGPPSLYTRPCDSRRLGRPCLLPSEVRRMMRFACLAAFVFAAPLFAQAPPRPKPAATVNGKEITEVAVQRALKPVAKENRDKARSEVINFLIDNSLVDQYLELLKVEIDSKEVEAQFATFKKEIVEAKQDYAKVLERMEITEAELKIEIRNQLRWEKFLAQQATEEKLKKLFEASTEIFDGSMVRGRHILVTAESNDEKGKAAALKKIQEIKAAVDSTITTAAAKVPADTDNLTKQKQIYKIADDAFSAAAREYSSCPSKRD